MSGVRTSVIAACILLSCTAAAATVIVPADLRELAQDARAIVHGRVTATEPRWLEGRRSIETLVTVEVAEYLKGDLGREVTFRVPGGRMGPYRSIMAGAPAFRAGEEVIVFLGGEGPAVPWVLGLSQGVYRVTADLAGVRRVSPGPSAASGDSPERVVRGDVSRALPTIESFTARVRTLAARRPE